MWHIKNRDTLFYIIYICLGSKKFVVNEFFGSKIPKKKDLQKSLEWSITRGNRNGRTAWQFIIELASDNEIKIKY